MLRLAVPAAAESWRRSGRSGVPPANWGLFIGIDTEETVETRERLAAAVTNALDGLRPAVTEVLTEGRAAGLAALHRAAAAILSGKIAGAVVGGVDSLVRPEVHSRLLAAGVLKDASANPQGIRPGEAAAFLVLEAPARGGVPLALLAGMSSTGHLILAGALLDFNDARGKLFEIVIQSAAILAVVWEFRARIGRVLAGATHDPKSQRLLINVAIAFVPLAVLGLLFGRLLKTHLFNAPTVAATFILGGLVILWAERRQHAVRVHSVDDMTALDALKVGLAQCLALIPGTSRSGATIIGGMLFGLSRQAATEFTFFLAIPTLGAASLYSLYKDRALLSVDDLGMWAVGMLASFISAFFCVRWLLRYISTHSFVPFAWYRIVFGIVVLVTAWSGLVKWVD